MTFIVGAFVNGTVDVAVQTKSYDCAYDLAGGNAHTQAYEYLKTLPEFAGATDC